MSDIAQFFAKIVRCLVLIFSVIAIISKLSERQTTLAVAFEVYLRKKISYHYFVVFLKTFYMSSPKTGNLK